jgi:hypothetical protein
MDDWLDLHKGIDPSTDLLIQDFLHDANEFENANLTSIALIKESANYAETLKWYGISQVVQDVDKLLS